MTISPDTVISARPAIQPGASLERVAVQYVKPIRYGEFDAGRVKIETGGFTPKTRELDAMRSDISVAAYEFLQNLSYGLDYKPPPVVLLELRNGKRIPFTGNPDDWPSDSEIVNCQFITSCNEGITVSEAVISAHDETKPGLGFWGRGLKHATAFLLDTYGKNGTEIEINASYTHAQSRKRHSWVGRYSLDETTDGRNKQLNMHWAEVDQPINQTVVTISRPPKEFLKAIREAGSTFLPMNPNYRGGLYVPGNGDKNSGIKSAAEIGGLQVELLEDGLIRNLTCPTRDGFVDGNRFKIGYFGNPLMFPWHFAGGLDEKKVKSWAAIRRGEDSKAVRDIDNINLVLRAGLNEGKLGVEFWDNFLERMYQLGSVEEMGDVSDDRNSPKTDRDVPLELRPISSWHSEFNTLTDVGKKTLQKAWQSFSARHPDIAAIHNDHSISSIKDEHKTRKIPHKYKVLIAHGLYDAMRSLDKPPKSLLLLHEEHTKEAALMAEPIERFQMTPVVELGAAGELPGLFDAFRILGTQEGMELTAEEGGKLKLTITRDIGVYYFQGRPGNMFPKSEDVREALVALVSGVNQRQGEVNGTFIEAGSNIARFKLTPKLSDKKRVLLATGDVKDTFKDSGVSKLQFDIQIPADYRSDIERCMEHYAAGQVELISKLDHMDNEAQMRHVAEQATIRAERAEEEIHLLRAQIEELTHQEREDLQEKRARYEAGIEELSADRIAMVERAEHLRREVLGNMLVASGKLGASAAATGVGGILFKEFVLSRLAANPSIQNGAIEVKNGVVAIVAGLRIPTLLGGIEAVKAAGRRELGLYWAISPNSVAIDAGDVTYLAPEVIQAMYEGGSSEFILPQEQKLEYKSGGTMVYVEGMTPGYDTGGFYRTSYSNTMRLNRAGSFIEGSYEGDVNYRSRAADRGRPKKFIERQVYKAKMPTNYWVPLALRLGEVPLGYAGVEAAEFRQNTVTGGWEVNLSDKKDLVVYTGQAAEEDLAFLKREPSEHDKVQLLDPDTLRPDVRNALESVAKSNLTEAEKIDEVLAIWRRVYLYDKGRDVKENFPMDNLQVYTSAMINKGIGPCGYSAYGAQALLRAAGIPANVIGGLVNESYGTDLLVDELHATIVVWNKETKQWYHMEPQIGRATERFVELQAGSLLNQVLVADSVISGVSPQSSTAALPVPQLWSVSQTDPQLALAVGLSEGKVIWDLPSLGLSVITQGDMDKIIKQIERQRDVEAFGPYAFAGTAGAMTMTMANFIQSQIKARQAQATAAEVTGPQAVADLKSFPLVSPELPADMS